MMYKMMGTCHYIVALTIKVTFTTDLASYIFVYKRAHRNVERLIQKVEYFIYNQKVGM